jgi:hypothetical protein
VILLLTLQSLYTARVLIPLLHFQLGALAKLQKATISFVMSVRLSVCMEQLGFQWKDTHDTGYLRVFWKAIDKIHVSLKSDKNNRYFTQRPMYIFDHISLSSSYNKTFFTKVAEKIKLYILYSVTFFENCALYVTMWKNTAEQGRP